MERRCPDFVIPGFARCGTTWLYEVLKRHPSIFLPERKELDFFKTVLGQDSEAWNALRGEHFRRLMDAGRGPLEAGADTFSGRNFANAWRDARRNANGALRVLYTEEQIAALELMALDPRQRVLAPRFMAGVLALPLLAILFSAIGIIGAWLVAVGLIGIDPGNFWSIQQNGVDVWRDVGNGVVKSFVFGIICTAVALYQGYEAEPTPAGVAAATTRSVVIASLSVLGMDFILTALMFSTP